MKYSADIVDKICTLFATGDHTVAHVCKQVGISEAIFYKWKTEKVEFLEALKRAEGQRLEAFKMMARSGLALLLSEHEYEETTTEYVDSKGPDGKSVPKIKSRKVTKKRVMPNATAVIFTLKNRDSENYKDKHEVEHSGRIAGVKVTIAKGKDRSDD